MAVAVVAALAWVSLLRETLRPSGGEVRVGCPAESAGLSVSADGGRLGFCREERLNFLAGRKMDLNRASAGELMLIKGVGEKTARAAIEARRQRGRLENMAELSGAGGPGGQGFKALLEWVELR